MLLNFKGIVTQKFTFFAIVFGLCINTRNYAQKNVISTYEQIFSSHNQQKQVKLKFQKVFCQICEILTLISRLLKSKFKKLFKKYS